MLLTIKSVSKNKMLRRIASSVTDLASRASRSQTPVNIEEPPAPNAQPVDPLEGLANYLMKKSEVPEKYREQLRPLLIQQIIAGRKYPDAHTDDRLMSVAKHSCTKEWIKRAIAEHEAKSPEFQKELLMPFLDGIGMILGHGFDKSEEKKFIKDETGKIIGTKDPRATGCQAALQQGETFYGGKKRKTYKKKFQKKRKTLRGRKVRRNVH